VQKTIVPVIEELSLLVQRAKRAAETTRQLAQEHRFIVKWYGMRPRSRMRPLPMLDRSDPAAGNHPEGGR
jgi:hypothetical protein